MSFDIHTLKNTIETISLTGKDLGELITPWAENRGLLGPLQRYFKTMQAKTPDVSKTAQQHISHTYGLFQVMKDPRLVLRFQADEKELSRTLSGPELQLLNNVQYHKPWKFDFFHIIEQLEPEIFKIRSLIDQEISVIILAQDNLPNSFSPFSVEQGWVIGSILIPLGELEIEDQNSDHGTSEIPGVMSLFPILDIPYFSKEDLGYLLESTAVKKGLATNHSTGIQYQHLWTLVEGFLVPGFLLLAHHPELLEILDSDEEPNFMVFQNIHLAQMDIPGSKMKSLLIDWIETQMANQEFHREQRSSWLMLESLKEKEGLVQPRQIFFCEETYQLLIRVMGVDPKPEYQQLIHSLQTFLTSQVMEKENQLKILLSPNPERVVSLSALLLGQDLFGIDVPGPPRELIEGLLLGY